MQSIMNVCFLMRNRLMRKKGLRLICIGGRLTAHRQGRGAMPSVQGKKGTPSGGRKPFGRTRARVQGKERRGDDDARDVACGPCAACPFRGGSDAARGGPRHPAVLPEKENAVPLGVGKRSARRKGIAGIKIGMQKRRTAAEYVMIRENNYHKNRLSSLACW